MSTTYTTRGPIRGCCGHQHKTHAAAYRCVAQESATQSRHNCMTDRQIVAVIAGRAIVHSPDGYGWAYVRDELPAMAADALTAEIAVNPVTSTVVEAGGMLYSWRWL
jgi:hypothetical protein